MALNKLGKVESKECRKFFTIIHFNSFRIIYMVGEDKIKYWSNCQNFRSFGTSDKNIFIWSICLRITCISFIYNVKCLLIIYFHTTFQDPDASFDVNSHDKDPQPHYDYTNENRWQFVLWMKNWKHKGRSEQSASSCPQNAKVQLIFSWSGNYNLTLYKSQMKMSVWSWTTR